MERTLDRGDHHAQHFYTKFQEIAYPTITFGIPVYRGIDALGRAAKSALDFCRKGRIGGGTGAG